MKIVNNINKLIFREYDIRGIVGEDLSEDVSYTIGVAFGNYIRKMGKDKVIIAHDNRDSALELFAALKEGLFQSGVNVFDLGLSSTPMFYYAKKYFKIESGIMLTASHNPSCYNGYKISFDLSGNACGKEIYDFRDFLFKGEFEYLNGRIEEISIKDKYIDLLINSVDFGNRKVKVVVDLGNSVTSIFTREVLDKLGITYCLMNEKFDYSKTEFLDPSVSTNKEMVGKKVVELGYDFGIAVDGDGDRVGIVDENGRNIPTDYYMIIMYRYLDKMLPKRKALYDVKCSRSLIDELKKLGIEGMMYRTGNSYMNRKFNQERISFGGEFSGHLWFGDKFPSFDDGIYAGLRMIEVMSNGDKKISELLDNINRYYATDEIKFEVSEEKKFLVVSKIQELVKTTGYHFIDIDGVRIELDDAWILIRASNTSNNLTVRIEAGSIDRLNYLKDKVTIDLKKFISEI